MLPENLQKHPFFSLDNIKEWVRLEPYYAVVKSGAGNTMHASRSASTLPPSSPLPSTFSDLMNYVKKEEDLIVISLETEHRIQSG